MNNIKFTYIVLATYDDDNYDDHEVNFKKNDGARWILPSQQFKAHHPMPLQGIMKNNWCQKHNIMNIVHVHAN